MSESEAGVKTLTAQYQPETSEKRLYAYWEKLGVFSPSEDGKAKGTFCLIMPPPNVTGVLHIGHALMATLEDVIVRRKRMQGFRTLWLPGTDHAGIATQMMVERKLAESNQSRHDLGREKFLEKVWEWKENSQGTILSQLRKIGSSADWSRLHFTLDEGPARAVRECFVRLYKEGLIYRSTAMIHWCPPLQTVLSDLEVKYVQEKGKLWHLKYVLDSDPSQSLVVATTRPETLFGDVAVAVHPEDERYQAFHGKKVRLPLTDKTIPVITDAYVEREFGTGALKITPAHDMNDYEIGKRHQLPIVNILDEWAKLNEHGGKYQGLSVDDARQKVVEDLQAQGLLEKEEKHVHNVAVSDRGGAKVEPRISQQWFVNAEELAKEAIRVVEEKEIEIVPSEWEKTYFDWMRNIRPWCISRQLWWGHRIPVWYCQKCEAVLVRVEDPDKCSDCGSSELKQDEDVLDTWFSSGLWPFSTLGWPENTQDLKEFYPTDVMETGFDILFFWVARMVMLGLRMTGEIPFRTVYLHPMVRDEYGKKMSKTKGNVKDPLEIIDTMGADALRMYFVLNTFHGRDVRVTDSGLEGSRNFVNKLWNASRFVLRHFGDVSKSNIDWNDPINQWIWHSLNELKRDVNQALDEYRFYEAANKLYHFTWDTYCSWFVEFIKTEDQLTSRKANRESTAVQVLEELLRLLHPMLPFVTEEIWQHLPWQSAKDTVALAAYPEVVSNLKTDEGKQAVDRVIQVVEAIRAQRGLTNLPPSQSIQATLCGAKGVLAGLKKFDSVISKLGGLSQLSYAEVVESAERSKYVMRAIGKDLQVFVLKADLGDVEAEFAKMHKEIENIQQAIQRAEGKLKNKKFVEGAPAEVVQGVQRQRDELQAKLQALKTYLEENAV